MRPIDRNLLRARASYVASRLGWAGVAGATALGVAVAASSGAWLVLRPQSAELELRHDELRRQLETARQTPSAPAAEVVPEKWAASLPDADIALRFLESVQNEAQQRSLQIEATEYRRETLLGGRVLRYRVSMPVRGTYPALRAWLEEIMYRFPTMALDELTLRRDGEGNATLVGRVQLSHYSRTGS
jgi:hypothetical protein